MQTPVSSSLSQDDWLARMDGEPDNFRRRILPTDLVEPIPAREFPYWHPPLKLRYAEELHSAVMVFCMSDQTGDRWTTDFHALCDLIGFIWSRRFPLKAEELWDVLHAHGVPNDTRKETLSFYEKGRTLLTRTVGKVRLRRDVVQKYL